MVTLEISISKEQNIPLLVKQNHKRSIWRRLSTKQVEMERLHLVGDDCIIILFLTLSNFHNQHSDLMLFCSFRLKGTKSFTWKMSNKCFTEINNKPISIIISLYFCCILLISRTQCNAFENLKYKNKENAFLNKALWDN